MATIISSKTSGVGGLTVTGDASGVLQLASADGTTAVTIDASQNVGIGTSSPSAKLAVSGDLKVNGATAVALANSMCVDFSSGGRLLSYGTNTSTYNPILFSQVTSDGNYYTERMCIDSSGNLLFNSGYGSAATAYGCRAWVNFNGTGTVAIRASGNVSSITDNGTGHYTVNFTTAMPDANFTTIVTASLSTLAAGATTMTGGLSGASLTSKSTTFTRVWTKQTATLGNPDYIDVVICR
jgi:hypothetical protein